MSDTKRAKSQSRKQYALFIGRWQPWHDGHDWLIRQKLDKGIPVLVAVRDVKPDENNPWEPLQVVRMISEMYADEDVSVLLIPDIESVNYGRGVGYEINEHVPPTDIAEISATEIRGRR
jgi:nicotinamide mononucleotide adenylyltransferase